MNTTHKIIISVVAGVLILGSGVYYWIDRNKASSTDIETASIASPSPEASPTSSAVINDPEAEAVHAAFVLWVQAIAQGTAKQDPYTITQFKKSGNYARFSASPVIYVDDINPGFGFAKKEANTWTILMFGTGGDPTEFYRVNNIPVELREAGL